LRLIDKIIYPILEVNYGCKLLFWGNMWYLCVFNRNFGSRITAKSVSLLILIIQKHILEVIAIFKKYCTFDFDLSFLHHGDEMVWSVCILLSAIYLCLKDKIQNFFWFVRTRILAFQNLKSVTLSSLTPFSGMVLRYLSGLSSINEFDLKTKIHFSQNNFLDVSNINSPMMIYLLNFVRVISQKNTLWYIWDIFILKLRTYIHREIGRFAYEDLLFINV
jgi:hypothetical protein